MLNNLLLLLLLLLPPFAPPSVLSITHKPPPPTPLCTLQPQPPPPPPPPSLFPFLLHFKTLDRPLSLVAPVTSLRLDHLEPSSSSCSPSSSASASASASSSSSTLTGANSRRPAVWSVRAEADYDASWPLQPAGTDIGAVCTSHLAVGFSSGAESRVPELSLAVVKRRSCRLARAASASPSHIRENQWERMGTRIALGQKMFAWGAHRGYILVQDPARWADTRNQTGTDYGTMQSLTRRLCSQELHPCRWPLHGRACATEPSCSVT